MAIICFEYWLILYAFLCGLCVNGLYDHNINVYLTIWHYSHRHECFSNTILVPFLISAHCRLDSLATDAAPRLHLWLTIKAFMISILWEWYRLTPHDLCLIFARLLDWSSVVWFGTMRCYQGRIRSLASRFPPCWGSYTFWPRFRLLRPKLNFPSLLIH